MTMLKLDQALKQLRAHIQEDMDKPLGIVTTMFVPWPDAPLRVPLPAFHGAKEPTQAEKVTQLFQVGFLLTTQPTRPRDIEYVLFSTLVWMTKAPRGAGIRGNPSQQNNREEFVQVLESRPDGTNWPRHYAVRRNPVGEVVALGPETLVSANMTSVLMAAFWAGVDVGKVQRELYAIAHPQERSGS